MISQTSNIAGSVDSAFWFIVAISLIMLVGVTGVMLYFAWRYRHSRVSGTREVEGNIGLEITWTVLPTILVLAMFWVGYEGFALMRSVPEDTMLVKVSSRMWSWQFAYENGRKEDVLVIPQGKPVRLAMTSEDVLHSLFIPAFRVKEDTVPGQETTMWFTAEEAGEYDLFCTEYCGVGHSSMITRVRVLPEEEFTAWYEEGAPTAGEVHPGEQLLREKGCIGCHSTDGTKLVGPSLKGIMGRETTVLTGDEERTVTANAEYIKRSIREPQADVVKGFAPVMPVMPLSDEETEAVLDYLGILK